MKHHTSVFVAMVLDMALVLTSSSRAEDEKKKKTEVEGTWKLTKGGKGAPKQLVFTDNEFVVTLADDGVFKGTFKINTEENPSCMDMTFVSGPIENYKGKVALCIYKFDGDGFTWCATIPGRKRRAQQFAETMGDVRLLLGTYEKVEK